MESYRNSRRLLIVAFCVWAIAWVLPSFGESSAKSVLGWNCYRMAVSQSPSQFMDFVNGKNGYSLLKLLEAISPWTNLLVPLAILLLAGGRAKGFRGALPGLFIGSWIVNLVWLKSQWGHLQIGYFVWMASFLCLGLALTALRKHEGSPFVAAGQAGTSSPVARVVAWIVLAILLGLAVQVFAEEAKDDEAEGAATVGAEVARSS